MYPPVTQFETRDQIFRQELELVLNRRRAEDSAATSKPWWLRLKVAAHGLLRGDSVRGAELRG